MRMRKKKNGKKRIEALRHLLVDATVQNPLHPHDIFGNDRPCALEIGCGKGDFICGMAQKYPERNFIAVERVADVIITAMEKVHAAQLENVRFYIGNAAYLCDLFAHHSFSEIYLNFSDPWPKAGHAKRRLTHPLFIRQYRMLLKEGGDIAMKTDNDGLFAYSLEQFAACGYRCEQITDDLHRSPWQADNVETEYEKNFSAKGMPIHRLVAFAQGEETEEAKRQNRENEN